MGDSDSEEEQERLTEYESVLKEHDPSFSLPEDEEVSHDSVEWYQLHLATERIRTPEILFQVKTTTTTAATATKFIFYLTFLYSFCATYTQLINV